MTTQPEALLENELIAQLENELRYERVKIKDEAALIVNLKKQLEKHNNLSLSEKEFAQILNHLRKGNSFEKAKTLRDKVQYKKDDGSTYYLELLNLEHWCQNEFQVTSQVTMKGERTNRYDVTLLINGLPLVSIELKKRGLELKEAFKQNIRYTAKTFPAGYGLFQYVQLFVISNGVNTKYYAHNRVNKQEFKQTFYWNDKDNKKISNLSDFAEVFLEPCHISKMITKYVVLNETEKMLMVLRPYQYYATEAIINQVKNNDKNGYIWHTTGSGKTLTSYKASQILTHLPKVHKVLFVVDRKDLDYQTIKEFNSFSNGSIDGTSNTKTLVKQLTDDTPLIVTTIQKLNTAISKKRYLSEVESLQDKKIVFIFDECHRSQFGDTHKRITKFFTNAQLFGFTGTPIFVDNAVRMKSVKRTTKDLFGECLHKYVITNAIRDENVLKFSVEYISTVKKKENIQDINVEDIDKTEVMEAPQRLENIVDYIIANHKRKTHDRRFTSIFCTPNIKTLTKYYDIFQEKKEAGEHDLRIGTIFSYGANSEVDSDDEEDVSFEAYDDDTYTSERDKLDTYIGHYNQMFGTNYSTKDSQTFYNYYNDISKRVKNKQVDILLVVNMFLTGFDSKYLNTLYVDKNLKHHGLIQAYSRTNRILDEVKSQGNIVVFRNLKKATDEAIALFSNPKAKEEILLEPYEDYIKKFNEAHSKLTNITPTHESVDDLVTEEDELEFVKAFRELMRVKNVLESFTEFKYEDIEMEEQTFSDFQSKYLDLYDKVKTSTYKEKVSILDDIDFEIELMHRDEINVAYIMRLLGELKDTKTPKERAKKEKAILDTLSSEVELRSKRTLIEKFMNEYLPTIEDSEEIEERFDLFISEEKKKTFDLLVQEENLDPAKLEVLITNYLFMGKTPQLNDIIGAVNGIVLLKERKTIGDKIMDRINDFVDTYEK